MNKQGLIAALAARLDLPKARAAAAVEALFAADGIIAQELRRAGRVQVTGFGNFEVRRRAARRVKDPHHGRTLQVDAADVPAFRAGKALKDAVAKRR